MAQPLLTRLKASGATIDVLAPEWVAPVARRMPEASDVIGAPLRHGALQLRERWRLAREVRRRGYDQAFVLPNTWKSALVPFLAGIPTRVGYTGESRYGLLNVRVPKSNSPMPQHYARLGGELGEAALPQPKLQVAESEVAEARRRFGIAGPYVALCPGAEYGPAKRWPYFRELAQKLGPRAVVLGSQKDAETGAALPGLNLVGKTTLDEAIRLIAGADAVVS